MDPAGSGRRRLSCLRSGRAPAGEADDRLALAVAVVLAVLAAKTYAAFYPFSSTPQSAAYAMPFAAILLTRLHLVELGRRPGMRAPAQLWLAALAVAGAWVTVDAARTHTVAVDRAGRHDPSRPRRPGRSTPGAARGSTARRARASRSCWRRS